VRSIRAHLRIAIGASAALASVAAAGAVAAGGESSVIPRGHAEAQAQLTAQGSAVARCPSGKVVSGGFSAPGFDKESLPTVRMDSAALGKREWKVDALIFGDGGDDGSGGPNGPGGPAPAAPVGTIVSHAYCAPAPGRIRVAEATAVIPANSGGSVTARCGRRWRAIGGGFASPDLDPGSGQAVLALSSMRAGRRGWTVGGVNASFGDGSQPQPGSLSAIAYCSKSAPRLIERSQQATVGGQQYRTLDVSCPAGAKAVSGGFDGNLGPLGEDLNVAGAVESYRVRGGAGWTTSAVSVDEAIGATITAFAYCLEKQP